MKNMKFLAFAAAAIMMVSSVVYFNSCKKDPCKDVVCNNGGTCTDGTCACTSGYEGTDCSTEMRTKFIFSGSLSDAGTTDSSYNNSTGHVYSAFSYVASISKNTATTDILINNLGNYNCSSGSYSVSATVNSSTTFTIASQVVCGTTFSGSGTLNSSGKVVITYTATYADPSHSGKTITDHGTATQL